MENAKFEEYLHTFSANMSPLVCPATSRYRTCLYPGPRYGRILNLVLKFRVITNLVLNLIHTSTVERLLHVVPEYVQVPV